VNAFEQKNAELIKEFNRYVRKHPKFAEQIPNDAIVILQLEGDDEFNAWTRQLAKGRQSEGQPVVLVRIKKMKPLRSRIEQLELEQVAPAGS
jgi:hypothetical protein